MYILGINLSHHASICLFENEKNIFYLEYDRISSKKEAEFDVSDQVESLQVISKYVSNIDHVIFTSFGKNQYYRNSDNLMINYMKNKIREYGISCDNFHFYNEHHLYHACNAFYSSKFKEAAVLVLDGGGFTFNDYINLRESESMYYFSGTNFDTVKKHYSHHNIFFNDNPEKFNDKTVFSSSLSCGWLFNTFQHITGLEPGKAMGLSSYGDSEQIESKDWFIYDENTKFWRTNNKEVLDCYRKYSGDPNLDPTIQNGSESKFRKSFDEDSQHQITSNLAKKIQEESKTHTIRLIGELLEKCNTKNIVLSGGYMLNCVNNYEYLKAFPDINFYVDPIAHDGGTAIGAAKYLWHCILGNEDRESLETLYLG